MVLFPIGEDHIFSCHGHVWRCHRNIPCHTGNRNTGEDFASEEMMRAHLLKNLERADVTSFQLVYQLVGSAKILEVPRHKKPLSLKETRASISPKDI
jgi:hypothetical protein